MVRAMGEKKINSIFNDPLMFNIMEMMGEGKSLVWKPIFDIIEFSDKFVVVLEIPGVDKDSLNVAYSNKILTISGYKKDFNIDVEDNVKYVWLERICGEFSLEIELEGGINIKEAKAEYLNGVLKVFLPKIIEGKEIHKIPVQWK